jgi:cell division protein FtsB
MDDPKEVGFWIVASGTAGTILWNILNYLRSPTFVRRSSLDELKESNNQLRAEMADLRTEVLRLRIEIAEQKTEIRRLMNQGEVWRDLYLELKAKTERG